MILAGVLFLLVAPPAAAVPHCLHISDSFDFSCGDNWQSTLYVPDAPIFDVALEVSEHRAYGKLYDNAYVYPQPAAGQPRFNMGAGFIWIETTHEVQRVVAGPDGESEETWYRINPGQYIRAGDIERFFEPSSFQGVYLSEQPARPFGWIVSGVYPSSEPGGPPNANFPFMPRYRFFHVYNTAVDNEGRFWYDVGEGRWVHQFRVSLAEVKPRPAGIGPGDYWVEIDLYEQTLAAYVGDRMVYATLVSTGLRHTVTRPGLFQVWARVLQRKMSGGEGTDWYYYLQRVPHIQYFDGSIGLHAAYWHDGFGYRASRGCVNMPPRDAEWLYRWSANAPNTLWVWVHSSQ